MQKQKVEPIGSYPMNRRQFLRNAGYRSMALLGAGFLPYASPVKADSAQTVAADLGFEPDLDISLISRPDAVSIFPGSDTRVWRYQARINKGDETRVNEIPHSYLGPIIRVRQGEKVRIRYTNDIPQESIIHWHGLHVPAIMDGHPRNVVSSGKSYLYEFKVTNRAGTNWYHPHPHGKTGPQVYGGMAGLFLVSDEEEQGIGLPDGEHDVPLVIQDRSFDSGNQLVYLSGHPMARMTGFLGDRILVNGRPDFTLTVSTTAYRLRLLNGSNSRIYDLAWSDGRPLTVIGTDGGLLERPIQREHVLLAPGERIELWADFSDNPLGYQTTLASLPFDVGMMGSNTGFPVCMVRVSSKGEKKYSLPRQLSNIAPLEPAAADNWRRPRQFFLNRRHMQWAINGRTFQMEDVAADEVVRLGSKEIWEFANIGGGMGHMMNMPHPIHMHGKPFRVVERSGVRHGGYMDEGLKDTVLLMPGERVKIMTEFKDHTGLFLYHCHNLEHEDMGMMRNYFVREA